jgi:ribose-phosphate pyrophosphokinase
VDDEIATGRTVADVADLLVGLQAGDIVACCLHPVLVEPSLQRLQHSPIREVVATDTLPVPREKRWPGLTVLPIGTVLAEVIQRIHSGVSVDSIFQNRTHPALS